MLIVTPLIVRFVPSHQIYLLALPKTILPTPRSKKAPASVPVGAEVASGTVPPFKVPAVISPKFADIASRLLAVILSAVTLPAAIRAALIVPAVISPAFKVPLIVIVPAD